MPRVARFEVSELEAWYPVHSRVVGRWGDYPLCERAPTRRLIETIKHYSRVYFCEVAAFCVICNHYHLNSNSVPRKSEFFKPGKNGNHWLLEGIACSEQKPLSPTQSWARD